MLILFFSKLLIILQIFLIYEIIQNGFCIKDESCMIILINRLTNNKYLITLNIKHVNINNRKFVIVR